MGKIRRSGVPGEFSTKSSGSESSELSWDTPLSGYEDLGKLVNSSLGLASPVKGEK